MHKQVEELTALVAAAEADDLKAEAMKWRQMYEQARRSQADAMDNAARSAKELDALRRDMQAIGRAVGEQDLRKVVRATQAFVRQHKVTA
jgi:predicted  nucleic acid-binding Zn-ribbon protein